jgi:hypothetical protein
MFGAPCGSTNPPAIASVTAVPTFPWCGVAAGILNSCDIAANTSGPRAGAERLVPVVGVGATTGATAVGTAAVGFAATADGVLEESGVLKARPCVRSVRATVGIADGLTAASGARMALVGAATVGLVAVA